MQNEGSLSMIKRKNELLTEDQIARKNKIQKLYDSTISVEKRLKKNSKKRIGNLNDAQIKKRREQDKSRRKLTRAEVTRDNSKESGLIVKWDYTNPCEL